jgi:hypothetical protein
MFEANSWLAVIFRCQVAKRIVSTDRLQRRDGQNQPRAHRARGDEEGCEEQEG